MKKIAIFIYSLGGGGAERVALDIAVELGKTNEVEIVTLSRVKNYDTLGVKTVALCDDDIGASPIKKLLSIFSLSVLFAAHCKKDNIDVVLSFLSRPNIICAFAKILTPKLRVIATEHTTLSEYYKNSIAEKALKILLSLSYKIANKVVAVSDGIASDLRDNFGVNNEKLSVIYNPIDISRIRTLSLQKLSRNIGDGFVFVTAGRLVETKNYPFLFEAFKSLPEFCKLWVLGSGELERELKFLAVELGIHERVRFFGFCENPYAYFAAADCFVSASRLEGLPTVLIEALACGLPVVATDCKSGPREILGGAGDMLQGGIERARYGVLVGLDSPVFLSVAMQKIISDDSLGEEYKAKAKQRSEFFSKEKSMDMYEKLINGG